MSKYTTLSEAWRRTTDEGTTVVSLYQLYSIQKALCGSCHLDHGVAVTMLGDECMLVGCE